MLKRLSLRRSTANSASSTSRNFSTFSSPRLGTISITMQRERNTRGRFFSSKPIAFEEKMEKL